MSQQPKPVPCKGCGKPIIFERQEDGKWLVSEFDVDEGEKLGKHNCPNYKPKPKSFEKIGGVVTDTWTGTNKQGQMFEARVSQGLQESQTSNQELILKMLTDISRKQDNDRQKLEGVATNVLEILGLLQDQFIKKQDEAKAEAEFKEVKEIEHQEKQEEHRKREVEEITAEGDDYGF